MASTFSSSSSTTLMINLPSSILQTPFLPKTSQRSMSKKKKPSTFVSKKVGSCKASNEKQNNAFDRRDILLGLGSLYGATNLVTDPFAWAAPIVTDPTKCREAIVTRGDTVIHPECCPPITTGITDFVLPDVSKMNKRYRPPAHLVDPHYREKFALAMKLMKELPEDDPRSFMQQANIHCAYCDGAYNYTRAQGQPDERLKVHGSWLFYPFHRFYLYFFERILGKLIDDPDFAIPFWNWDSPSGMSIPAMYADPNSSLYNVNRNPNHQPPNLVDLNVDNNKKGLDGDEVEPGNSYFQRKRVDGNLTNIYRQMVSAKTTELFHGAEFHAFCDSITDESCVPEKKMGSIEGGSHLAVHLWVGDRNQPFKEDMGNFYSAGRDPLFYAHHANVDRMWKIWRTLPGGNRSDPKERDWLDSSFVFCDENGKWVRVTVEQSLELDKLGYDYEAVDEPWRDHRPKPKQKARKVQLQGNNSHHGHSHGSAIAAELNDTTTMIQYGFPIILNKLVRIEVPRPKKSGAGSKEEEVLVLQNIELDGNTEVKFDVLIEDDDVENPAGPEDSEFAGSFRNIPHGMGHNEKEKLNTNLTLPISDLLKDLNIESKDKLVVTLVPRDGEDVSIGNIKIDYVKY